MERERYFIDWYFQFGNVRGGSTGVGRVVGEKGLFSSSHYFWLMAPSPTIDVQTLICRDRTEGCHRNFIRISSEVAPPVFFSHYPLMLKTVQGIVGTKSWICFLESAMSL